MSNGLPSTSKDRIQLLWNLLLTTAVVALLAVVIIYRDRFSLTSLLSLKHKLFPCRSPITYSLDRFDNRFDITEEAFLQAVTDAETIWESALGRELFKVSPNGGLKINLIYDYRQAGTEHLAELGINIENDSQNYDSLKSEYDKTYSKYAEQKSELDAMMKAHDIRVKSYNNQLAETEERGGANQKVFRASESEREQLNAEVEAINAKVLDINATADAVNVLADALNKLAEDLNITADKYNTIGESLGDEFVEGTFGASINGSEINIYQFENSDQLTRVLAHELGHALGLQHVNDPDAIMYRLNEGDNIVVTEADLAALKDMCKID